jgi:hypothetical protein
MKKIKDKESMIKVKTMKQVIFVDEISKTFYKKIEVIKLVEVLNSRNVILINVKDTDLQAENCFLCHKSDHISKKCLNRFSKINALNKDKFDHFVSESDSDSKN